jgi:hypothetical protein
MKLICPASHAAAAAAAAAPHNCFLQVNDAQARTNVERVMATKPFKLLQTLGSDLVYVSSSFSGSSKPDK